MMRWLFCAVLLAVAVGCGKYGPPIRALPPELPEPTLAPAGDGTGAPAGGAIPGPGSPASEIVPDTGGGEPRTPDLNAPSGGQPDPDSGVPQGEIDPGQGTLPDAAGSGTP